MDREREQRDRDAIQIVEDVFGEYKVSRHVAITIKRFTMTNRNGFSAQVINYGATLTSLMVPDRNDEVADVVLGFDNIEGYVSRSNPYMGATIGRTSNRITNGRFSLDGVEHQLSQNEWPNLILQDDGDGLHHYNGGVRGFNKKLWNASYDDKQVIFTYLSKEKEEGYPGRLLAQTSYEITSNDELIIRHQARCTEATPIDMSNLIYFNLAGNQNAETRLAGHFVSINANEYTRTDETLVTTGEKVPVKGTIYDFRKPKNINDFVQRYPRGVDHNFCLNQSSRNLISVDDLFLPLVAKVENRDFGRQMEIYTNQPGLQFYTGNRFSDIDWITGKGGVKYSKYAGMSLQTQGYPDAVNHESFSNTILRPGPGEMYKHTTIYNFSVPRTVFNFKRRNQVNQLFKRFFCGGF